jgi:hypothetical protein
MAIDPHDEYSNVCRDEAEAELKALDISGEIRENMIFEDGAWIGVPSDDHHDEENEAWAIVETLRKKRREWVAGLK